MSSACSFSQTDVMKIREWLAEIFEDKEVPPFEETEEAIETLKKMMAKNLEAEKNTRAIIRQEQELTEKYNKASEELNSRLDCGIQLCSQTSAAINCLAHFARDLNLKEPTSTNFLLAMHEAERKEIEMKKEERTLQYHLSSLGRKVRSTIKTNEILSRDLKDLKKTVEIQNNKVSSIKSNVFYFKKKKEEYDLRLKKYEKHLENVGFEPALHHHNLVEQSQKIQEMEEQLKTLVTKLKAYESLPPNEELTRLKVQEAQQEVQALEEEFQKLTEHFET